MMYVVRCKLSINVLTNTTGKEDILTFITVTELLALVDEHNINLFLFYFNYRGVFVDRLY